MLRENMTEGHGAGICTGIGSLGDPSVIIRTHIFIEERLAYHYDPNGIRHGLERLETHMMGNAAELYALRSRAYGKHFDENFGAADYVRIFETIERCDPADMNTLTGQDRVALPRVLRKLEDGGFLKSERDNFYWYITDDGKKRLKVLRELERLEALDVALKEDAGQLKDMWATLSDYELAIGNIRRIAPNMVALGIEGFRRPDLAAHAVSVLGQLIGSGTIAAPANQETVLALEALRDEECVYYDEDSGSWRMPEWERARARRLLGNLKSGEGKQLVEWYAQYKDVMHRAEKKFEDWARANRIRLEYMKEWPDGARLIEDDAPRSLIRPISDGPDS